MSETSTQEITLTKSKAVIILKTELTGRDMLDLESSGMAGDMRADKRGVIINAATAYKLRLQKLVELIVVSVNGNADKSFCWNALLGFPSPDYNELMGAVNRIHAGLSPDEEKKIEG